VKTLESLAETPTGEKDNPLTPFVKGELKKENGIERDGKIGFEGFAV
jgi:hypothetical protein